MNISSTAIRTLQKEKGLTGYKLAEMAHLKPQSISAIKKRGTTTPTVALAIAEALGVDLEEITEKKGGDGLKTKAEAKEWLKRSAIHVGFTDANEEQPQKSAEEFRADQTMQNMAERVQFLKLLNADEISWADLFREYAREYAEMAAIIRGLKGSE